MFFRYVAIHLSLFLLLNNQTSRAQSTEVLGRDRAACPVADGECSSDQLESVSLFQKLQKASSEQNPDGGDKGKHLMIDIQLDSEGPQVGVNSEQKIPDSASWDAVSEKLSKSLGGDIVHAVLMGLICGSVHVVGPDHLGTLLTLSVALTPSRAFRVGSVWGFGHCMGMLLIAAVFLVLHKFSPTYLEAWEHYGDYLVGVSMILVAMYFFIRQSAYLTQEPDGTCSARPCGCCSWQTEPTCPTRDDTDPSDEVCGTCDSHAGERRKVSGSGTEQQSWWQHACEERSCTGVIAGLVQGACCPMGLIGLSFVANLNVPEVLCFLLSFVLFSVLGIGLVAMGWAYVTSLGIGKNVSLQFVYYASCFVTLMLGVAWIVANYFGVLPHSDAPHH